MPTGYTHGLLSGEIKTFRDFAMNCARDFGAMIHMREDSQTAAYTPAVASDYSKKRVATLRNQLAELYALPDGELAEREVARLNESESNAIKAIADAHNQRDVLESMLYDVLNWLPPTSEHDGLKDFMIEQIEKTIEADCVTEYAYLRLREVYEKRPNIDVSALRRDTIKDCQESIRQAEESLFSDLNNANDRNAWISELIESINKPG